MKADSFCEQFVYDMIYDMNTFDSNYNTSYRNNIFYSYRMPICQHIKIDNQHYFEIVDRDQSPSTTTTKHISKITSTIQEIAEKRNDITIVCVQEIVKRELNNEQ